VVAVQVFRVAWEQRYKPMCKTCCVDDDNHPWEERFSTVETDKKRADRLLEGVYDVERDGYPGVEVRNVRLQTTTTEWVDTW
jgi:hypothetical protein